MINPNAIRRGQDGMTLALVSEMTGFATADIALVAHTVAKGATLQELAVFLHACGQLHLDPLLRQAYWIRRKDKDGNVKGTLQVGIDGFRAIAEATGVYAGAEPIDYRRSIEWTYNGAKIVVPESARSIVWKVVAGHKSAFTGEAFWSEFVPSERDAFMWAKMPRHMLGKVAEAQALRKAFPAQLAAVDIATALDASDGSGYDIAEMPQDAPAEAQDGRRRTGAAQSAEVTEQPEPPAEATSDAEDWLQ